MQIRLLGPVGASHGGRDLVLGAPRQRAVFAMLALNAARTVSTDLLVDGIWGEHPPTNPLASLQVYVHGLRRALAAAGLDRGLLASRAPGYCLDVPVIQTDLGAFERDWERSRELSRAPDARAALAALDTGLARWRGPGLADLRQFPFAVAHAARLDEAHALAQEDQVDLLLACGEHARLVSHIETLVAQHPTRERRWGQLMIALYRCNRQADALAAFARARDLLADELGIDPGDALRQLEVGVLRHDPQLAPPALPAVTDAHALAAEAVRTGPAEATPARPRNEARLPQPTTSTWGRDELADELAARLADPGLRLLSLVGPGGTGKTRLATLVAARAQGFSGGRFFLEAEEGQDATALLTSLVLAVGGPEPPDPTTISAADTVADQLPVDPVLVVLDNLEVVPDAAYAVEALVKATTGLTLLATSRLPLRLEFGVEVVVPPVELPPVAVAAAQAGSYPAVALFVDRAGMVNHRFRLDDGNAADVVELCRLLDGMPLAIELAAARMRLLSPGAAVARLRSGLSLLSSSPGSTGASARTLTGTIDWSLAHLTESARALIDDLCVFEDGFGLEAVESITALHARTTDAPMPDPVEDLSALLECGLVHLKQTRVELRYHVLGPVRAHLRSAGDQSQRDRVRALHLAWMRRRLPGWAAALDGPDGDLALGRFDDEHADLLALIGWALGRGQVEEAAELAAGAQAYWVAAGRIREGLAVLDRFTGLALPDGLRRALQVGVARLAYYAGEHERTERVCRALIAGSPPGFLEEASAHCYLGAALVASGAPDEGVPPATTALDLARQRGEWEIQAVALSVLAISAAMTGDLERERSCYEERLEVVRARGDRARIADTLNTLAEIALDEPDLASAQDHVAESLRLAGEHRPMERRDGLITSARIAVLAGENDRAAAELSEALDIAARTGQPHAAAQAARATSCLLVARGEHRSAVRLFAAAHALAPPEGEDGEPFETDLRAALRAARAALDTDELGRLWRFAADDDVDTATVIGMARAALTSGVTGVG
ncbi:MAG TPA: BTAD domain-containing putative transcriptional regulator [Dermatophilaceae bacterium]|nr:BTAD domain-containing putative transcriptional regulator [Dermatophilaceae bacterium]